MSISFFIVSHLYSVSEPQRTADDRKGFGTIVHDFPESLPDSNTIINGHKKRTHDMCRKSLILWSGR